MCVCVIFGNFAPLIRNQFSRFSHRIHTGETMQKFINFKSCTLIKLQLRKSGVNTFQIYAKNIDILNCIKST